MKMLLRFLIGSALGAYCVAYAHVYPASFIGSALAGIHSFWPTPRAHAHKQALLPFGKRRVTFDAKGNLQIYLQSRFVDDPAWGARTSELMARIAAIHGIINADIGSKLGVPNLDYIIVSCKADTDWSDLSPQIAPIIDARFPP